MARLRTRRSPGVTARSTDGGFVELSDAVYAASEFLDPDRDPFEGKDRAH